MLTEPEFSSSKEVGEDISIQTTNPVDCGDTLYSNTILENDLEGCHDFGLELDYGVELDCAGHMIYGAFEDSEIGVILTGGNTVKNCVIEQFAYGMATVKKSG